MTIIMKTERILSDGSQLEPLIGTEHGWPSIEEGTDALCKCWNKYVTRLPKGYEEKDFDETTEVKLRVTFYEGAS